MARRHLAATAIVATLATLGLAGCGGTAASPTSSEADEAQATAEATRASREPSKKPSTSPSPTQVKSGCEAAAETLDVEYGDPEAHSDIVAEGFDRTWRHGLPVTITNVSDQTCMFLVRGQLLVEGERAGLVMRQIALRPQQVATLGDVPVMEELMAFEPADAEAGKPTVDWDVTIRRIEGQELAPDFYDYDIVSIEPHQRSDAEYTAGIWPMFKSYVLNTKVKLNAVDPEGKYPDVEESLKTPGVMTTIYINGLDADGVVVATWTRTQVVRDEFIFEIPSVGGGEVESGLTQRGDVFFQSLDAVESVVEYDVVTVQPMDLLDL